MSFFDKYSLIAESGLFDPDYYRKHNTGVVTDVDPVMHYLEEGARRGFRPSALFDVEFYLEQCHAAGEAPDNPLLHFLESGSRRGLLPNRKESPRAGMPASAPVAEPGSIRLFIEKPDVRAARLPPVTAQDLLVGGWAVADCGVSSVEVKLDGRNVSSISTRIAREDVMAAFGGREDALRSGFEARLRRRELSAGAHRVEVVVTDRTGAMRSTSFQIEVRGERPNVFETYPELLYEEALFRMSRLARHQGAGPRTTVAQDKVMQEAFAALPSSYRADKGAFNKALESIVRSLGCGAPGLALTAAETRGRYPRLRFGTPRKPTVSIVIPVFNQFFFTYQCLSALAAHPPSTAFEVFVVDDGSTDETRYVAQIAPGVKIIRQRRNAGFIASCNLGAAAARGDYLMMLNNDAMVTAGAVDALAETLKQTGIGLAGSKLLYPDGSLQEAGAIVWRDGTGWNYGQHDDPDHPHYSYLRDVDYCSGAAIMVPRFVWQELAGFDRRYCPAYYEDADLAFRLRKAGYRTVVQPLSVVIHAGGATSGTELDRGPKVAQRRSHRRFVQRWQKVLASHRRRGDEPLLERDRGCGKRALFVDANTPTPDQDAGSNVAIAHMRILQSLGYKVTFVASDNLAFANCYTPLLQRQGIEAIYQPYYESLEALLRARGPEFDVAYVHRYSVGEIAIPMVRRHAPRARVLFNNADLHYLRMEREAALTRDRVQLESARRVKARELAVISSADCTILCNTAEMELLRNELPQARLRYLPWVIDAAAAPPDDFSRRKGIMFLGGFGHPPNIDAVKHFVADVMPYLRRKLTGVKFHVYGSKMPREIQELGAADVVIEGYAANLEAVFRRHRVSVAPLRFGAGFKGKIAESLAHGLPVVATSIACEGTGLTHGFDILVANQPKELALLVGSLYRNKQAWKRLSSCGLRYAADNYSFAAGRRRLEDILRSPD